MLRVKSIINRTPVAVHRRSKRCMSKITKADILMDDAGVFKFLQGSTVDPPAHGPWKNSRGPYRTLCKLYFDEKQPNNPRIFIWCDCEWFTYNCEVSLAIRGSSAIINSNGALPKMTNPNGRPQVCKHCLAFLRKSLDRKRFSQLKPDKKPTGTFSLASALSRLDSSNLISRRMLKGKFPEVFKQNKPGLVLRTRSK